MASSMEISSGSPLRSFAELCEISVHPGRSYVSRALIEQRRREECREIESAGNSQHVTPTQPAVLPEEAAQAAKPETPVDHSVLEELAASFQDATSPPASAKSANATSTRAIGPSSVRLLLFADNHLAAALAMVAFVLFVLKRVMRRACASTQSKELMSDASEVPGLSMSMASLSEHERSVRSRDFSRRRISSSWLSDDEDEPVRQVKSSRRARDPRDKDDDGNARRKKPRLHDQERDISDDDSYQDPVLAELEAQAALAQQQAMNAAESFSRVSSAFHVKAQHGHSMPLDDHEFEVSSVVSYSSLISSVSTMSMSVYSSAPPPPPAPPLESPSANVSEKLGETTAVAGESEQPRPVREPLEPTESVVATANEGDPQEPAVVGEAELKDLEDCRDDSASAGVAATDWDDICTPPKEQEDHEPVLEQQEPDMSPPRPSLTKRVSWADLGDISDPEENSANSAGGAVEYSTPIRNSKILDSEASPTSVRELFLDPPASPSEEDPQDDHIYCSDDMAADLLTTTCTATANTKPVTDEDRQEAMRGLVLPSMGHAPSECRRLSLPETAIRSVQQDMKKPEPPQPRRRATTASRRLSESVQGQLTMIQIANMERDLYNKVRTKFSEKQIATKPVKMQRSCKQRLKNAKLLVRVVLGEQRDQLHGAAAVMEALDTIAEFKVQVEIAQEELTKAETVFSQLQDDWDKVLCHVDPAQDSDDLPGGYDGHATDIYDHAKHQVQKLHEFLRPDLPKTASTSSVVRRTSKLLNAMNNESKDEEPSLLDGIVGVWTSRTSIAASGSSSLSNPKHDSHLPLSLQDTHRVVRSVLGNDHAEVSSRDSLKAIQIYGMLQIQSKRIEAKLEQARDRFQELNSELYRLHELHLYLSRGREVGVSYFDDATNASLEEVLRAQVDRVTNVLDSKLY